MLKKEGEDKEEEEEKEEVEGKRRAERYNKRSYSNLEGQLHWD